MKKNIIILITVVIAIVVVGWLIFSNIGQNQSSDSNTTVSQGIAKASNFHLQDYNGKIVNLADFAGKLVVINSWAAWCPFCGKELADFAKTQKEFGDKVAIIAVDRAESLDTAKKYTDDLGVTNDIIFLLDPSDGFYQSIGGFAMPETVFVNSNGDIIFHKRGPMDIEEIRGKIQQLLR